MPNIQTVLKEEISRLARKEIKKQLAGGEAERKRLKQSVSDLKKRVAELEKAQGRIHRQVSKARPAASESEGEDGRFWVTAKGIRSLREKLGLSQADFGTLIGVTGQTIYQWERKDGKLNVRQAQRQPIIEARQMGVKDARRRLEELEG